MSLVSRFCCITAKICNEKIRPYFVNLNIARIELDLLMKMNDLKTRYKNITNEIIKDQHIYKMKGLWRVCLVPQ